MHWHPYRGTNEDEVLRARLFWCVFRGLKQLCAFGPFHTQLIGDTRTVYVACIFFHDVFSPTFTSPTWDNYHGVLWIVKESVCRGWRALRWAQLGGWDETPPAWLESSEEVCLDPASVSTFKRSDLIDGSCHVLNRSIFLPLPRLLTLHCKQRCRWVTSYLPPSVGASCQLRSAAGNACNCYWGVANGLNLAL